MLSVCSTVEESTDKQMKKNVPQNWISPQIIPMLHTVGHLDFKQYSHLLYGMHKHPKCLSNVYYLQCERQFDCARNRKVSCKWVREIVVRKRNTNKQNRMLESLRSHQLRRKSRKEDWREQKINKSNWCVCTVHFLGEWTKERKSMRYGKKHT